MNALFDKQHLTEADVESITTNAIEETTFIEFKGRGALDKAEEKKTEISKDVSAFANAGGGTLIYGIKEENHKAAKFDFVDGTIFTKEWLEQVISSRIQRKIDGLRIIPIRINGDLTKTVYIVNIPESTNAPYMAYDKKFYKRNNVTVMAMEEYEVRQLYGRMTKTQLKLDEILIQKGGLSHASRKLSRIDFRISFQVRNVGTAIENHYKVEISIPNDPIKKGYEMNTHLSNFRVRREDDIDVYSFPCKSPLFQDELTTLGNIGLRIDSTSLYYLNQKNLSILLYYSNGTETKSFVLLEILKHNDSLLTSELFS